jgi:hypothetical protein
LQSTFCADAAGHSAATARTASAAATLRII